MFEIDVRDGYNLFRECKGSKARRRKGKSPKTPLAPLLRSEGHSPITPPESRQWSGEVTGSCQLSMTFASTPTQNGQYKRDGHSPHPVRHEGAWKEVDPAEVSCSPVG